MTKRRKALEGKLGGFMRQYGRTHKNTPDPNDRWYDRDVEKKIRHMDPVELDCLLHGDADDDDVAPEPKKR